MKSESYKLLAAMWVKKSGVPGSDTIDVPVVFFEPGGASVSTTLLGESYPDHGIPEERLSFVYPPLEGYLDTVGALWYLQEVSGRVKFLVNLMIVGYSPDSVYHFFIDRNSDRVFDEKDNPVIFRPGERQQLIMIRDMDDNEFGFLLNNPVYREVDDMPPQYSSAYKAIQERNRNRYDSSWIQSSERLAFNIRSGFLVGPGKTQLEYATLGSANELYIEYKANIFTAIILHIDAGLSYKNVTVGGTFGIETLMYSKDHKYTTYISSTGDTTTRWSIEGKWPKSKFRYGLFAEYAIRVSKELRLTPFVEYSGYTITSDEIFSNEEDAALKNSANKLHSLGGGIRNQFIVKDNSMLNISIAFSKSFMDARDYFTDIQKDSFKFSSWQLYIGVSYQYRFPSKREKSGMP